MARLFRFAVRARLDRDGREVDLILRDFSEPRRGRARCKRRARRHDDGYRVEEIFAQNRGDVNWRGAKRDTRSSARRIAFKPVRGSFLALFKPTVDNGDKIRHSIDGREVFLTPSLVLDNVRRDGQRTLKRAQAFAQSVVDDVRFENAAVGMGARVEPFAERVEKRIRADTAVDDVFRRDLKRFGQRTAPRLVEFFDEKAFVRSVVVQSRQQVFDGIFGHLDAEMFRRDLRHRVRFVKNQDVVIREDRAVF